MFPPDRPAVELLQAPRPLVHVLEAAKPHEPIGAVEVAELADDLHPDGFLRLDELGVEQLDEHVPLAGPKRVLAQLDDGHGQMLPGRWPYGKIHGSGS